MKWNYLVFNNFMERGFMSILDARLTAVLNAACVMDYQTGEIYFDYRTPESEADEIG